MLKAAILEPAETSQINFASHSQPVCTAIQIALVVLLSEWDITPTAVVGHSSGETEFSIHVLIFLNLN